MDQLWLSLVPFIVVIIFSMALKEIMPGLVIGLLIASYMVKPSITGGLYQAILYLEEILTDKINVEIILFLYLFGGLVGMMQIAGGINGFAEFVRPYINTERKALVLTWISIPFTIMTPMFRIMIMAPILRAIKQKIDISKERIGYILDISTEPIIVLIPVGTAFVGYMVTVVSQSLGENQIVADGIGIFIQSIPFNFFAIIMIILGIATSFFYTKKQSSLDKEEGRVKGEGNHLHRAGIKKELEMVNAKPFHLFLPIFILIVSTLIFLYLDGREQGAKGVLEAFTVANATMGMLIAIFVTLILSTIVYLIRKESLNELLYHFFDGGNQMMNAIVLLILVWSVAMGAEDLGFSSFIANSLGAFIPTWLVPAIIFLLGSIIGYFIGTSWGIWGLFMPLGVSLAVATGASIPLTVGAVFASGTFGAFASPLGDTTITTATILEMAPVEYAKYKLKISLIGVALSVGLYLFLGSIL